MHKDNNILRFEEESKKAYRRDGERKVTNNNTKEKDKVILRKI